MLKDSDILSIITQELDQSMSFNPEGTIGNNAPSIEKPLEYYLGLPNGTEVEGKSQVMSTDVADAIEWIMPQIMKSLTSSNEVVSFDPTSQEDEDQAELETAYVYDILMKKNEGFIVLHEAVKDALLQRNGIVKTYYEQCTHTEKQSYTGLSQEQLVVLLSQPNIEPLTIEETEQGINVEIKVTKSTPKIQVEAVPLENFYVNSDHNSVSLENARFIAHNVITTISDLRQEGIDEKLIEQISPLLTQPSNYRHQLQGESVSYNLTSNDPSTIIVSKFECYLKIDMDEDGIAEYHKITVAGEHSPNVILSIEPLDSCPWVATTAILMSHKFQGLSIYDRLKQIQDQKTALIRNILDNIYLINNQQKMVIENMVNMDDLLTSRVGGNIRVKRQDAIQPLITAPLDPMSLEMVKYLDTIGSGRVGVSAEGATAPQHIGDRVGSQGVAQLMTAKEELVGLIIRLIAETLVKPLCLKIRDLAYKHFDTIENYKFKGQWQQVQPTLWPHRSQCTIRVGTGSGDKAQKLQALKEVQVIQTALAQSPAAYLIDDVHLFRTVDDYLKTFGLTGAARYMLDPSSPEAQQAKQQSAQSQLEAQQKQEQLTLEQLKMEQSFAQAELQKAQAQTANVELKHQVEMLKQQLQAQQQEDELKIAALELQLTRQKEELTHFKNQGELAFKYDELEAKMALEHEKLASARDVSLESRN